MEAFSGFTRFVASGDSCAQLPGDSSRLVIAVENFPVIRRVWWFLWMTGCSKVRAQ
jgi:hypothetical protein